MNGSSDDRLWSAKETASYLGIPLKTLYQFNYKGTGPTFYRVGKQIKFFPTEVIAWVRSKKVPGVVF